MSNTTKTSTTLKKYAVTAGICLVTLAIVHRFTFAEPIRQLVYGG